MSLLSKLHTVQSEVGKLDKAGENKFQGYKYVMLGTILEKLAPLLKANGLVVTQSVKQADSRIEFTEKCYYSISSVTVETTVADTETGDKLTVVSSGFSTDKNSDKSVFKATTGARKYGLSLLFKAHWDAVEPEDDSQDEPALKRVPPATKTQPSTPWF
jgi:hypothetical protein